jgi:hypothetical protein
MRKLLFKYSLYSHPENGNCRVWQIAGLPPGQPLPQRNRPETLTIKRNHGFRLSGARTRATRKITKSSPIQGDSWGKVTSQRGTRSSYMTPNKNLIRNHPQNSATKITIKSSENHQKGGRERQHKRLRNHAESSINTMKVHTRSSLPPNHPSLSLDLTLSSQASPRKLEKIRTKMRKQMSWVPTVGCHPSPQEYIWRHPKDQTTLT